MNKFGDAACPVGHVRHTVGPGLQQDKAERIGTARQCENIDTGGDPKKTRIIFDYSPALS